MRSGVSLRHLREGGKLQAFLQSECERYRGQLQKYAKVYGAFAGVRPRCALYFPMLREWVEIDLNDLVEIDVNSPGSESDLG